LFHDIFEVLKENPSALKWLQDKGVNAVDDEGAYLAFLNAVEVGLRNVARTGSRLFQKNALASRANWQQTPVWRKHRCVLFILRHINDFVLLYDAHVLMHVNICPVVKCICPGVVYVRTFLGQPNYLPYYKFRFCDYIQRINVIKTYNVRHLAMTQGKSCQRYSLEDPPEWDVNDATVDDPNRWGVDDASGGATATTSASTQSYLEYDSEQDEWIEVYFISVLTLVTPVLS